MVWGKERKTSRFFCSGGEEGGGEERTVMRRGFLFFEVAIQEGKWRVCLFWRRRGRRVTITSILSMHSRRRATERKG